MFFCQGRAVPGLELGSRTPGTVDWLESALQIAAPWGNTWMRKCDHHTPRRAQDSLLDQLYNALGVHEEDLPVGLGCRVQAVAVQDGGYLSGENRTGPPLRPHTRPPQQSLEGSTTGSHAFKHPNPKPSGPPETALCASLNVRRLRTKESSDDNNHNKDLCMFTPSSQTPRKEERNLQHQGYEDASCDGSSHN